MAQIDNLKERLLKDAGTKASSIENEAGEKADEILKEARQMAEVLIENNKIKAEKDGRERYERMISRAHLEIRNKALEAKQQAIEKVLGKSLEKVSSMNQEEYLRFMEGLLEKSIETGEEEVVFSLKDKAKMSQSFIDRVNASLAARGKRGMLKLSGEAANIQSGFLLRRGGLEINCSIESIIKVLREDLEGELARLLFENQN